MDCGKRQYSKRDAIAARNRAMRRRRNRPKMLRIYQCPDCGYWHLTHKPKRGEAHELADA